MRGLWTEANMPTIAVKVAVSDTVTPLIIHRLYTPIICKFMFICTGTCTWPCSLLWKSTRE